MSLRISWAYALFFLAPAAMDAQAGSLSAEFGALTARLVRGASPDPSLSGLVAFLRGRIAAGPVALEGAYAQGTLSAGAGSTREEDLVDGELLAVWHPWPWASLRVGPRYRAFVSDAGTERWTRFEARAGVRGDLLPGRVRAEVEFWTALNSETNVVAGGAGASGGMVALAVDIARSPFALRLFYSADRARFKDGGDEVLEGVGLGLVLRRD